MAITAPPTPKPTMALSFILIALVGFELFHLFSHTHVSGLIAIALVVLLPVAGWKNIRGREIYLFAISSLLVAIAWWLGLEALDLAIDGLGRAAFLATFIVLMALLREGAMTSDAILQVGRFLTHQPPARRFFALFSGAHFFSALINLGSLSLFAPIIQRGVRADLPDGAPLDEVSQIRERRQLSAALRGFSWFLVWAPTAVTQAVMPTLMTGIESLKLIGIGLCLAGIMLLVSWVEDTLRWRSYSIARRKSGAATPVEILPLPAKSAAVVLFVACILLTLAGIFSHYGDVSLITGVMLGAPLVVTVWIFAQHNSSKSQSKISPTEQLQTIALTNMPVYIREIIFVACAGFIGTVGAGIVPVNAFAEAINLTSQPHWLVLWSISILVWILGQVGLSPVTMAVFLGSIVAEITGFPVDITLTALAIAAGTAICSTGAPFSSGIMMLSRATGYTPFTLSWRWNGTYTLMAMFTLAPVYALLTQIF